MNTTHIFLFTLFCAIASAQYVVLQDWNSPTCNATSQAKIYSYWIYPADGSCFVTVSGGLMQGAYRVNYTSTQITFTRYIQSDCTAFSNVTVFPRDACNGLTQAAQIYKEFPTGEWYLEYPTQSILGVGPWEIVMVVDYYDSDSCGADKWVGTNIMGYDICNSPKSFQCLNGTMHYIECDQNFSCDLHCIDIWQMDGQCYNNPHAYTWPWVQSTGQWLSVQMTCDTITYDSASNQVDISLIMVLPLLMMIMCNL